MSCASPRQSAPDPDQEKENTIMNYASRVTRSKYRLAYAALIMAALLFSGQPLSTQTASAQAASCGAITPSLTEGPYYKAGSPERTNLVTASMPGAKITIT